MIKTVGGGGQLHFSHHAALIGSGALLCDAPRENLDRMYILLLAHQTSGLQPTLVRCPYHVTLREGGVGAGPYSC